MKKIIHAHVLHNEHAYMEVLHVLHIKQMFEIQYEKTAYELMCPHCSIICIFFIHVHVYMYV